MGVLFFTKGHQVGFNFRKRVKILPGVTLNIGKKGVSTSVGTRGARMTFGNGKTRTTVGLPGTGVSYSETTAQRKQEQQQLPPQQLGLSRGSKYTIAFVAVVVFYIIMIQLRN